MKSSVHPNSRLKAIIVLVSTCIFLPSNDFRKHFYEEKKKNLFGTAWMEDFFVIYRLSISWQKSEHILTWHNMLCHQQLDCPFGYKTFQ